MCLNANLPLKECWREWRDSRKPLTMNTTWLTTRGRMRSSYNRAWWVGLQSPGNHKDTRTLTNNFNNNTTCHKYLFSHQNYPSSTVKLFLTLFFILSKIKSLSVSCKVTKITRPSQCYKHKASWLTELSTVLTVCFCFGERGGERKWGEPHRNKWRRTTSIKPSQNAPVTCLSVSHHNFLQVIRRWSCHMFWASNY